MPDLGGLTPAEWLQRYLRVGSSVAIDDVPAEGTISIDKLVLVTAIDQALRGSWHVNAPLCPRALIMLPNGLELFQWRPPDALAQECNATPPALLSREPRASLIIVRECLACCVSSVTRNGCHAPTSHAEFSRPGPCRTPPSPGD